MHPPGLTGQPLERPRTETAAMTLPPGRTGAETDATPCSRSPTDCAQPRRRMPDGAAAENAAFCSPRCMRSGSSQASSTWAADPARIVSCDPTGIVSRRPRDVRRRPRRRGGAHPAAPELGGLSGDVAQPREHGAGGREQPVLAGGGDSSARGPSTNRPCMSRATRRWCSRATASRWAVGRARPVPATRPARWRSGLESGEHEGGLVEDADAAGVVHMAILDVSENGMQALG